MKMTDCHIQQFIRDWESIDLLKTDIVKRILKEIAVINNEILLKIMYGGIVFSIGNNDIGGLFLRKNHVSLEFVSGHLLSDPEELLEGTGKYRRHIKLRSFSDIKDKHIEDYLMQML